MYSQKHSDNNRQHQLSASSRAKRRTRISYAILITVFVLMCMLRLWYTVLLVFTFGLILTLKDRRRSFCGSYCPMATMQDGFYPKNQSGSGTYSEKGKPQSQNRQASAASAWKENRKVRVYRFLHKQWVKILAAFVFWGYLGTALYLFRGNPEKLWFAMFGLMMGSLVIAGLLQRLSRKRVWCSTICPYGNFLKKTVKFR